MTKENVKFDKWSKDEQKIIYNKVKTHKEISSITINFKRGQNMSNGIWTPKQQNYLDQRFEKIDQRFEKLETEMRDGFKKTDEKFDLVFKVLTEIQTKLNTQQTIIEHIAKKINL